MSDDVFNRPSNVYLLSIWLLFLGWDALEFNARFLDIDLARAGRMNFGQPLSWTLIKRITAKMTIAVTIKGTKRPFRLETSEFPCGIFHFFFPFTENVQLRKWMLQLISLLEFFFTFYI